MNNYGSLRGTIEATGANNAITFHCLGYGTCGISLRNTFVGTAVPEATIDNTNWFTLTMNPVAGGAGVTSATAVGDWTVSTAGYAAIRIRCSAYTSGTITVVLVGTVDAGVNNNISVTADTEFSAAAALADALSAAPVTTQVGSIPLLMNATTIDRQRAVVDTLDSTGTGIAAAGIVGQYDDASTTAVTENKFAPIRISSRRALLVEGVASGTAVPISAASATIASGAIASGAIASGAIAAGAIAAGATSIADNEDAASADADRGVKILVTQKATPANTAGTDGDYEFLQQVGGKLWVGADLKQVAGTAIVNGGVAGSQSVGGTVATNVAITANPLNLGAQAVSSENTAVTTARQVQLVADLVGKLIVLPYANPENFVSGAITTAMTSTTSTSLIAAPASGLRNYITQITVSNAHATVGTDIIIQDGSGGTTLYNIPAAAVYGGAAITFPTPLRQPTTATAIFCANVTTGASTKVSASGYKGA